MDIKRTVAALLAGLCLAASLSACSEETNPEDNSTLVPPVFESTEETSAESKGEESNESDDGFYAADITDFTPYITLGTYKGVKVERKSVTDELITDTIKDMLKEIAEYEDMPAETVAALEDKVNIDYVGYKLETMEEFEGGSAKGSELELGSGTFIPGFEEGVVGHKIGDIFDVLVTFPEDYHNAEYAGMPAKFTVTLNKISRPQYPEFNDETAQKLNYSGAEALRKAVVAALEEEAKQENMTRAWNAVMAGTSVKAYPEGSVEQQSEQYSEFYIEQYNYYAAMGGLELDDYLQTYYGTTEAEFMEDLAEKAKAYGETTVKQSLVMYAIADIEFGREISESEYEEHTKRYAEKEGISVEELLERYDSKVIEESIIWDKVMLLVYNSAIFTDIPSAES